MKVFSPIIWIVLLGLGCHNHPNKSFTQISSEFSPPDTISFVFAGDVMCHYPQVKSAETTNGYDFKPWFKHIKPIVSNADLAFANLETTLSKVGPYLGYPRFKSPDNLGVAIADAGFDVVVTANNHSNDSGKKGVYYTLDVLNSLGLYHTGTFKDSLHRKTHYPLIIETEGIRIGLLNYTYDTNGIPDQPPTIVNLIDSVQIKKDIAMAVKQNPDILLAFMHWGYEYHSMPNSKQRKLANMMVRLGVDHIVGAHPHVVQPIEIIDDNGEQHLVAYSLGNFVSNQKKYLTDGGIMLRMRLVRNEKAYQLLDWEYIPIWRYIKIQDKSKAYEIVPSRQFLDSSSYFHSSTSYNQMLRYHKYLDSHLNP